MDLAGRAAACLAAAARPRGPSPAWLDAVRLVRAGDGAGAAAALAPLDDRARLVATATLERLAAREGRPDVVAAVGAPLALRPGAVGNVTGWLWDRGWRDDVVGLAALAAWSDEPPNVDQAREQVQALAAALEREGRAAEAAAVSATLG